MNILDWDYDKGSTHTEVHSSLAQLQSGFLGQATLFQTHARHPTHPVLRIPTTEFILRGHSQNRPRAQGKLMLKL